MRDSDPRELGSGYGLQTEHEPPVVEATSLIGRNEPRERPGYPRGASHARALRVFPCEKLDGHGVPEARLRAASASLLEHVIAMLDADAASAFVLEPCGASLRGACGVWDWTRTSFRVDLAAWPNVAAAVESRTPCRIARENARALELDWFEPAGIGSCVCVPIVGARGLAGVLFLDHKRRGAVLSPEELDVLRRVASALVPMLDADHLGLGREKPWLGRAGIVANVMSRALVAADLSASASAARETALDKSVHHLLVMGDQRNLLGVLCLCDLDRAGESAPVGELMQREIQHVGAEETLNTAAAIMVDRRVGCLPVLDVHGLVEGVITRSDLRRAGALEGRPGVDACASCGATHDLCRGRDPDSPVFCGECLDGARDSSEERNAGGGD